MKLVKDYYMEVILFIGCIYFIFERIVAKMFSNDFDNASLLSLYSTISRVIPLLSFIMVIISLLLIIKSIKQKNYIKLLVSIPILGIFLKIIIDIIMSV